MNLSFVCLVPLERWSDWREIICSLLCGIRTFDSRVTQYLRIKMGFFFHRYRNTLPHGLNFALCSWRASLAQQVIYFSSFSLTILAIYFSLRRKFWGEVCLGSLSRIILFLLCCGVARGGLLLHRWFDLRLILWPRTISCFYFEVMAAKVPIFSYLFSPFCLKFIYLHGGCCSCRHFAWPIQIWFFHFILKPKLG